MSKKTQPIKDDKIIDVDAEVLDNQPASPEVVAILDKEVARLSKFEVRAKELTAKYSALTINGVEDKDGYDEVKSARSELRSLRISTEAEKKAAKSPYLMICSSIEEKSKFILSTIQPFELKFQGMIDKVDEEKERIKAEKKRKQDEQLIQRQQQLTALGAVYMEGMFVLEDVSFEASAIRECDDQIFEEDIKPKFQFIFNRKEYERKLKEENERKERERLAEEQKKLEQQREELARQQRDLERQQQEQRDKEEEERKKIIKSRSVQLESLGMKFSTFTGNYIFETFSISGSPDTFLVSDDEWDKLINYAKQSINDIEKEREALRLFVLREEQKKRHIQSIGTARVNFLKTIGSTGYSIDELGAMEEKEWDAFFADKKQQVELQQRQMEELKEKQRVELMKDKEKWGEIVKHLNATPLHEMRSSQYRKKMSEVRDFLETIKEL